MREYGCVEAITPPEATERITVDLLLDLWPKIRLDVRARDRCGEALLSRCDPASVNGSSIILCTNYRFHQEKLNQHTQRALLESVIGRLVNQPVSVTVELSGKSTDCTLPPEINSEVIAATWPWVVEDICSLSSELGPRLSTLKLDSASDSMVVLVTKSRETFEWFSERRVWRRLIPGLFYGYVERLVCVEITLSQDLAAMPYDEYLKTDHWQKTSAAAKERAAHKCQVCNKYGNLHTHHRTYERRGKELPEDLIVLCATCHALFHENGKLARRS